MTAEQDMVKIRANLRQLFLSACKESGQSPKDFKGDSWKGWLRGWEQVKRRYAK